MSTKERIIRRLNKAFGFEFTTDDPSYHHGGRGFWQGAWSWGISHGTMDVGSMESMSECLKWKKWVMSRELDGEIFEYVPSHAELYEKRGDLIEGEN